MKSLAKLFKWDKGRQLSGYQKMLLIRSQWLFKFDVYLLKFPQGSEIKQHVDTVTSGKHFRLNIVLKKAKQGGEFICNDLIFETARIKLFRPDICTHSVTEVVRGERYVLSIGWVK